jgi:hypothetical protein
MKISIQCAILSMCLAFYKPNLHLTLVPADVGPTWEKALEHCSGEGQNKTVCINILLMRKSEGRHF